jgi:hypothetical protein
VRADLEDDFHRFTVWLEHDGRRVTAVRGDARRFPWSTCPGAIGALDRLREMPLAPTTTAAGARTDPRLQCTHLFDLAALAVAHAAEQRVLRRYEVAVPDRRDECTRPTLARDGASVLAWTLQGFEVRDPAPFAGRSLLAGGFQRWCERELDPDAAEAAFVLRRACKIALGRAGDLDAVRDAGELLPLVGGSCHSFQPEVAARGRRQRGSSLDFTARPEALLADLEAPGRGWPS